jgi:hypothetical protein
LGFLTGDLFTEIDILCGFVFDEDDGFVDL